jgi:hypothetical protein
MRLVPFNLEYMKHIQGWITIRELQIDLNTLPRFGLIALDRGTPIAAGFIREVEGGYGMIDSFITDPKASKELRNEALDRITEKLIKIAKHNKVNQLIAYSLDKNTLMRGISHGFVQLDHSVIALDLSKGV